MPIKNAVTLIPLLLSLILPPASPAASASPGAPLFFIENVGQFDPSARFQARGAGGMMWLAEDAIWITVVGKQVDREQVDKVGGADCNPPLVSLSTCLPASLRGVNLKLSFPGANPHRRLEPFDRLDTTVSYFTGNDPARWRSNVGLWAGVRYVDLYPGIDLEISSRAGRWIWRLVPQVAYAQQTGNWTRNYTLRVEGVNGVTVKQHRLCLDAGGGDYCLPLLSGPVMSEGEAPVIATSADAFDVTLPVVSLAVSDRLDAQNAPLDDPADLVYSTYLGGMAADEAWAVAVDQDGNAYVAGYTGSTDFPTTPGAFDPTHNLQWDAYIVKLNASGTDLIYATFLGGTSYDIGYELVATAQGEVYVTGATGSVDFPTTPGAFDTSYNGSGDAFVARLSPDGADLVFATYLGGQSSEVGYAIDRDNLGGIYVSGGTDSIDFPTTSGAFDTSHNGDVDGYLAKLSSDGVNLIYGTYLGGSDAEAANAMAVASPCDAIITGNTRSADFPTTPGAYDPTYNGSGIASLGDAFAARLNCNGASLVYSTFLGSGEGETGYAIAATDFGSAVVVGETDSPNFPTTPGAYDPTYNGNSLLSTDAFVVKLNANGTAVEYGTFLGGNNQESAFAVALDETGNVVVTGRTDSADFPTTPGAFDTTFNGIPGVPDTFVSQLSPNGAEMIYSTFFDAIYGQGIASDGVNQIVFTGSSGSNLPTTPGAFDTTYNGGSSDAFVAKLNLNEPTAVGLVGLAAGSTAQAAKRTLAVAGVALFVASLATLLLEVSRRRSRSALR